MSRAVELAKKLDIWTVEMSRNQRNIEAFYHAARAEMAREAADHCLEYSIGLSSASHHDWPNAGVAACDLAEELRAMADNEGK